MNRKIGFVQFALLIIISRIFSEAMSFPISAVDFGMQRFTVVFLSKVIAFSMYLPLFFLAIKYPSESFFSLITKRKKWLGWIVAVPFIIEFVSAGIVLLVKLDYYIVGTLMPSAPSWLILALPTAAAIYGVFRGIEAVARTGTVIAAMLFLLIAAVSLTLTGEMDLTRLYPSLIDNGSTLYREIVSEVVKNNEVMIFAILVEYVREKAHRSIIITVPTVAFLTLLMTFLYNTVLGSFMNILSFPFYTVSSLADIVLFERLDGIDVAVWTLISIIKLSLLSYGVGTIIYRLTNERIGNAAKPISLILVYLGGLFFTSNKTLLTQVEKIAETGIPILLLGTLIPLAVLIIEGILRKNEKKPSIDTFD